jgi:hypothetical protein
MAWEHGARSISQEIERTGLFQAPPELRDRSTPTDPIEVLATATSADEVLRASVRYFAGLFDEVVALGIHKGRAIALLAGNHRGLRAPRPVELALGDGTLVRSVLDRPQVAYRRSADAALGTVCRAVGMPTNHLTLVPAFDYGRPAFVVVGQGLEEWDLKARFGQIKQFLAKVSKSLRIVALRGEIVVGEKIDARMGPRLELYAQAQVRGRSDVRIMAIRTVSTGTVVLEGTADQYPELRPGADVELVIFGFEDGHDEPRFNIECRARVLRVERRAQPGRGQGFFLAVTPMNQGHRERLTDLVLRELAPRRGSSA